MPDADIVRVIVSVLVGVLVSVIMIVIVDVIVNDDADEDGDGDGGTEERGIVAVADNIHVNDHDRGNVARRCGG